MTLQEAIEEVKREAYSNSEWCMDDIYELEDVSAIGEAIATILNAVVKGELK